MPKVLPSALKKLAPKRQIVSSKTFFPYEKIDFSAVDKKAKQLADIIESRFEKLTDILLRYESYEVVQDEVSRTLDLLRHLEENKRYFEIRVGSVTSFLPRNQPLYAFACFVIVPSFMASEVHFRIPHSMGDFFNDMLTLLNTSKLFQNVIVSTKQRIEFLTERSAMLINPNTKESRPLTDVVIFTGLSAHADQLRRIFDRRTLFIANGSGHNPIVISKDADLYKAVKAVLSLQFYNQGQDCSAPNAVLVDKAVLPNFLDMLRTGIDSVKVGHYRDKSCRIGPISDPKDLVRIQDFLIENREWLDSSTPGIIRARDVIVEPTIICKPLVTGGNFREILAPIVFIQDYKNDSELKYYFEDQRYAYNAMYISLYGKSKYVGSLIGRSFGGKILHDKKSVLRNVNPHALGFERGTKPYGGYGYGASSISFNEKIIPMPTLPQRDIYEMFVKPMLRKKISKTQKNKFKEFTKIQYKNVQKLLKLQSSNDANDNQVSKSGNVVYFDLHSIKADNMRYIKLGKNNTYHLLIKPNVKYISTLTLEDIKMIQALKKLLLRKSSISLDKLRASIYAIPKDPKATKMVNKKRQSRFFQHIYQLLLGKKSGPHLAPFFLDVEQEKIDKLLGV